MSRVLLLDDEPQMGALVGMCLAALGADVIQTTNLIDTVRAAREHAPAVMLLDLELAADDGLSFLPVLREEPALHGVPIIAFTVHDSRRAEAYARGVDGFIAKPFRTEALRTVVRQYLSDV